MFLDSDHPPDFSRIGIQRAYPRRSERAWPKKRTSLESWRKSFPKRHCSNIHLTAMRWKEQSIRCNASHRIRCGVFMNVIIAPTRASWSSWGISIPKYQTAGRAARAVGKKKPHRKQPPEAVFSIPSRCKDQSSGGSSQYHSGASWHRT
jgi:hypothetical protein